MGPCVKVRVLEKLLNKKTKGYLKTNLSWVGFAGARPRKKVRVLERLLNKMKKC